MKNVNPCWVSPVSQINDLTMKNIFNKKNAVCFIALSMHSFANADEISPIDCMIEPNLMVEISSSIEGVLETLNVDRSDEVKMGDVVATMKSDVEQVNVKISQERLKLSKAENDRAVDLYRKKVITRTEKDKLDNEKRLYELDLENAEANLDLRQIRSPIDGVVVKRYYSVGELVESKPIIKLAQLNPLKIEVISPVSNYGKIIIGMRAKVLPEHGDYPELIAEVAIVDKVIDAASGTFGVRLELSNKDHAIPSGLKCKVHFLPQETAAVEAAVVSTPDDESFSAIASSINEDLMCSTIGPYKNQSELNKLIPELESEVNHTVLRTETGIKTTYLIVSNEFATLQESRSAMQEMKAAGITDIAKMSKAGKHRIALGLYSQKETATNRVNALQKRGYEVQMKPRQRDIKTYWADIAYMPASEDSIKTLIPVTYKNSCNESIKLSLLNNE